MTADAEPGTVPTGSVHAQISVSDLDRSLSFCEMLGFEVISQGTITDAELFAALGLDGRRLRRSAGRGEERAPYR